MIDWGRLHRSDRRVIAGVCGGIAEYFLISPVFVRIIAVLVTIIGAGIPIIVYLALMLVMPMGAGDFSGYVDVTPITESRPKKESRPVPPETGNPLPADAAEGTRGPSVASAEPGAAYSASYSTSYDSDKGRLSLRSWYLWAILFILVLVAFGAFDIMGRFNPSFSFWGFWPVIVIACGICILVIRGTGGKRPAARIIAGCDVILVGLLLLCCSVRILDWGTVISTCLLWPLLAVALGLVIVGGMRRSGAWGIAAGCLVAVTLLLGCTNYYTGAHLLSPQYGPISRSSQAYASGSPQQGVAFNMRGIDSSNVVLTVREGQTEIHGWTNTGITTLSSDPDGIRYGYSLGNGTTVFADVVPTGPGTSYARSDIALSDLVEWGNLSLVADFSDVRLDLGDIDASSVKVSNRAGSLDLLLNDPGNEVHVATISGGLSNATIWVPDGTEVFLEVNGNFVNVSSQGSMEHVRGSDQWVTPGYSQAVKDRRGSWVIEIDGACEDIDLESYAVSEA